MASETQALLGQLQTLATSIKELLALQRAQAKAEYWEASISVPFISTTDPSRPMNYNFIDPNGTTGMVNNLIDCTQQFDADGFETFDVASAAVASGGSYSFDLLPLADLGDLYAAKEVLLKSVFFAVIDSTYDDGSDTWNNIINSLSTDRAYMQSQFAYASLPMFIPNFLRPVVYVNNDARWGGNLKNSELKDPAYPNKSVKNNRGHKTVGVPHPYESDNLNIYLGSIKQDQLRVTAMAGQYVVDKIQRYPVYAHLEFLVRGRK